MLILGKCNPIYLFECCIITWISFLINLFNVVLFGSLAVRGCSCVSFCSPHRLCSKKKRLLSFFFADNISNVFFPLLSSQIALLLHIHEIADSYQMRFMAESVKGCAGLHGVVLLLCPHSVSPESKCHWWKILLWLIEPVWRCRIVQNENKYRPAGTLDRLEQTFPSIWKDFSSDLTQVGERLRSLSCLCARWTPESLETRVHEETHFHRI